MGEYNKEGDNIVGADKSDRKSSVKEIAMQSDQAAKVDGVLFVKQRLGFVKQRIGKKRKRRAILCTGLKMGMTHRMIT